MILKIKHLYLFIFFIFIICSTVDSLSLNIAGSTVRYFHLVAMILAIILVNKRLSFYHLFFLFIFLFSHFLSGLFAFNLPSTIIFCFWILFFYLVFFKPSYDISKKVGDDVWFAINNSSRFLIMISILLVLLGIDMRAMAFFYEPAYMSIFLVPFAAGVIFNYQRKSFLANSIDFSFMIIYYIYSFSGAFIGCCVLLLFFRFFTSLKNILLGLILFPSIIYFWYISMDENDINKPYLRAIFNFDITNLKGLINLVEARMANRADGLITVYELAKENFIFGIGPKTYQQMSGGVPPTNIFIETVLNSGTLGLIIIFFLLSFMIARKVFFNSLVDNRLFYALLTMIIILQIEATYMRAYLWIFLGMFFGMYNYEKLRIKSPQKFKKNNLI